MRMSVLNARRADMCYCPGCSHGAVLEKLGSALDAMAIPADRICIVSDIGCIGTADRYFDCHTFHGLHGRSITYAEGIKRHDPGLLVIVLIGDGGCGIGTAHLVHAARRGTDIKVLVCNNFNFGMTGGQHSATTPSDAHTSTTPGGSIDRPLDVCQTVAVNGAAYAARFDAFDSELTNGIRIALAKPGFVLLDIWELCTAYFVPANKLNRASLSGYSAQLKLPFGVIHERADRSNDQLRPQVVKPERILSNDATIGAPHALQLTGRREITIAGSAGQRIRSAAGTIGEIAVQAGLFAVQQDDFPITVRRGFSISNLILSTEPIRYTALDSPDVVVVLSADGRDRVGSLTQLSPTSLVVAARDVALPATSARVETVDLAAVEKSAGKESAALVMLSYAILRAGVTDADSLKAAAEGWQGAYRDSNLHAIREGVAMSGFGARSENERPRKGVMSC